MAGNRRHKGKERKKKEKTLLSPASRMAKKKGRTLPAHFGKKKERKKEAAKICQ